MGQTFSDPIEAAGCCEENGDGQRNPRPMIPSAYFRFIVEKERLVYKERPVFPLFPEFWTEP